MALPSFLNISCVQCFRVSVPQAVRPTLLRQMNMGSLTCAQMCVRAVHTKGVPFICLPVGLNALSIAKDHLRAVLL